MSMYNLLEYSQNYSMISGSLWNYYKDKVVSVNDNASHEKSFKYKTKKVVKTTKRFNQPQQPGSDEHGNQAKREN